MTFVGSAATGARVAEACARRLAPIELELGGKSPNVVFADADLDKAVPAIVSALIQNAGQSCSAGSRLLVERAAFDDVIARVADALAASTIGPGIEDPDLGPLISERQLERATAHARRRAAQHGATIVTGGEHRGGLFLAAHARHRRHAGHGDLPGGGLRPRADRERRSTTTATRSRSPTPRPTASWPACGRATSSRAHRVAAGIRAGQIFVNGYGVGGGVELPFGGMKRSGYGRGKGIEALLAYSQVKNVCIAL